MHSVRKSYEITQHAQIFKNMCTSKCMDKMDNLIIKLSYGYEIGRPAANDTEREKHETEMRHTECYQYCTLKQSDDVGSISLQVCDWL